MQGLTDFGRLGSPSNPGRTKVNFFFFFKVLKRLFPSYFYHQKGKEERRGKEGEEEKGKK